MSTSKREARGPVAVTATLGATVQPFDPRRGLFWLAAFGAGGLGLSALYAATGRGLVDPLFALTGLWCPLCGGTRMGAELLHGQVGAAFAFNPLAFIGLIVAVAVGVSWTVESLGGPGWRPPAQLRRLTSTQIWIIVGLIALVFMIARNLLR